MAKKGSIFKMIDQQGYHDIINEATQYLSSLTDILGESFNELSSQDVEIQDLANALDALIFANQKLQSQKVLLELYRKRLQDGITNGKA